MQLELDADQASSMPTESLYHYTGEAALRGILEHRRPWCFSHSQQSDENEFKYPLNLARTEIRAASRRGDPAVESILTGLDDILARHSLGDLFDFYLFSLSRHRDHARQWEDYGHHRKGFAIGFAPSLFQPDQADLSPVPNENRLVGKVIYGNWKTAIRHRRSIRKLAEIIARVSGAHPHLVRGRNRQRWFDEMNRELLANLLIWHCLTAKAEKFRDEQETRYIIIGKRACFDGIRKQHNGRTYIETPLPLSKPGNITDIIVGPDASADADAMVKEMLEDLAYPTGIPVVRSSC